MKYKQYTDLLLKALIIDSWDDNQQLKNSSSNSNDAEEHESMSRNKWCSITRSITFVFVIPALQDYWRKYILRSHSTRYWRVDQAIKTNQT
ncbi:hypothetical protein K1719_016710 [Acacia pycnantha]|nr:hypothetical protein K1719_016710 [Acacia pycnantha]